MALIPNHATERDHRNQAMNAGGVEHQDDLFLKKKKKSFEKKKNPRAQASSGNLESGSSSLGARTLLSLVIGCKMCSLYSQVYILH